MRHSPLHGTIGEAIEAYKQVKILILWSGAVVPAYRQFFQELSRHMHVRVLSPRKWTHGSVSYQAEPQSAFPEKHDYEFIPTAYLPAQTSRYFVPTLIWHVGSFRPQYLYIMDEMDRPSFCWHALTAKLMRPSLKVVSYALQNLAAPAYYRWYHRFCLHFNQKLVSLVIAASGEAEAVLRGHGYRGPIKIIPLSGSEAHFRPCSRETTLSLRRRLGIPDNAVTLLFCGSLVEAKGLLLLKRVLPRFSEIRLVSAGHGPLEEELRRELGNQLIHLGGLEGDELLRFYQTGDYIILPSVTVDHWKEQVGRSLIEGILCGCIALGSDSGQIPSLTLFPETTFRQGDAESLAEMLGKLPLVRADSIRAAQRENISQKYTSAAVATATARFLLEQAA